MSQTTEAELKRIIETAQTWLSEEYDSKTQEEVKRLLLPENQTELIDSFYQNLAFGTGGVRGKMGVGINRINNYTLGLITQGLANYALKNFNGEIKVAIAYDTRNFSREFAEATADIFSANGITAVLFSEPRPTPELSFAIRHLKCQLGIVITASHNPKEYNGYKVYFEDGGQIVPPWDADIMKEVKQVTEQSQVKTGGNTVKTIDSEVDEPYFKEVGDCLFSDSEERKTFTTPILYSPIHGTGSYSVFPCLQEIGFKAVNILQSQSNPDGNFPTVISPNPEEKVALELGIAEMKKHGYPMLMATDPDSDRMGVVVNQDNEIHLLNGNQIGILLADYILNHLENKSGYLVRTIVTSSMIDQIAKKYQLKIYSVLTGFKYIAELIRLNEGKDTYLFGMEESYGYLVADFVRDKDAVSACAMVSEMFYRLEKKGITFLDRLNQLYLEHGYFADALKSVVKEGKSGAEEIVRTVANYRDNPPMEIAGFKVAKIRDYQTSLEKDLMENSENKIDLPKANVIQFELADRSIITVRPSGTEPKIKYYFNVCEAVSSGNLEEAKTKAEAKIEQLKNNF